MVWGVFYHKVIGLSIPPTDLFVCKTLTGIVAHGTIPVSTNMTFKGEDTKTEKDVARSFSVRFPRATWESVEALARAWEVPASYIIRQAVKAFVLEKDDSLAQENGKLVKGGNSGATSQ